MAPVEARRQDMLDNPKEFRAKLTTPQAAAFVGLGVSSLEKLRVRGDGPAFLKIGRRVVYDAGDLEQWLAKHKRASTSGIHPGVSGPLAENEGEA
jgi:predicted DNA-binding transcriptional regulator AlpA